LPPPPSGGCWAEKPLAVRSRSCRGGHQVAGGASIPVVGVPRDPIPAAHLQPPNPRFGEARSTRPISTRPWSPHLGPHSPPHSAKHRMQPQSRRACRSLCCRQRSQGGRRNPASSVDSSDRQRRLVSRSPRCSDPLRSLRSLHREPITSQDLWTSPLSHPGTHLNNDNL